MIWIIGIGCLFGGAVIGALVYRQFLSDEVRVRALEEQLNMLSEEHENYKSKVHGHFNNSAQLLNRLTDSYRDVYLHMADSARSLCPDYISSQLTLSNDAKALLDKDNNTEASGINPSHPAPPLDYAAKTRPTTSSGRLC